MTCKKIIQDYMFLTLAFAFAAGVRGFVCTYIKIVMTVTQLLSFVLELSSFNFIYICLYISC